MNKEEWEDYKNLSSEITEKLDNTSTYESWLIIQEYIDRCQQENQELKKQLEENQNPLKGIFAQVNDDTLLRDCGNMNAEIKELKNQQKEFIEYMNKTIEECNNYSKYMEKKTKELHGRSCGKTYIANEIMKNEVAKKILKEILSKYREIIGGKDD